MRIAFAILLLLHGLIHLLGFAKAFQYGQISSLTLPISKPAGLAWLASTLLFLVAGILYLLHRESWWMWAVPAVLLSQVLIFLVWKDAKYGTIPNLIAAAVIIVGFANRDFQGMVKNELQSFLPAYTGTQIPLDEAAIAALPPVVQTWIKRSNALGKPIAQTVHLKQKGDMRSAPAKKWMPVTAEQWFTPLQPGFIWNARVKVAPGIEMTGRDRYADGKGHMLIKVLSLVPVAKAKGPEADQGSMLRYLAEIVWFPSGALHESIVWEPLDSSSAKATMTLGGISASGIFRFDANGDPQSFEAKRYYDRKEGATLEDWFVQIDPEGYKEFEGIRIPAKSTVSWKLKEGDFSWFRVEITEIEYIP